MSNEELLEQIKADIKKAKRIFDDVYYQVATEQGEEMLYDDRFVQEEDREEYEESLDELYESFAHCTGNMAHYEAAQEVITFFGGDKKQRNDEDLQVEVMDITDNPLPSF